MSPSNKTRKLRCTMPGCRTQTGSVNSNYCRTCRQVNDDLYVDLKNPKGRQIHALREASGEFKSAVSNSGSPNVSCEHCGREHFAPDSHHDWEPGELKRMLALAAKDPDRYRATYNIDSISWGILNDKQWVVDCPCNYGRMVEDSIWKDRNIITSYLKARVRRMKVAALFEEQNLKGI